MRIATLIGRTVSGDLISLGIAEGNAIDSLLRKRVEIIERGGIVNDDVRLSEIRILATATPGGELRGRARFAPAQEADHGEKKAKKARK